MRLLTLISLLTFTTTTLASRDPNAAANSLDHQVLRQPHSNPHHHQKHGTHNLPHGLSVLSSSLVSQSHKIHEHHDPTPAFNHLKSSLYRQSTSLHASGTGFPKNVDTKYTKPTPTPKLQPSSALSKTGYHMPKRPGATGD